MKKLFAFVGLLYLIGMPMLAFGTCPANNPISPNALTFQGPDPTGNQGYPLAVVGATGCPLDVNITGGGFGGCVTQCTSPWIVGFGGVGQPVTQGTSPWVVGGTVTANQGGAPWSVSQSGTWNVGQSGTWTVQQGTPPWSVSQSGVWTVGATQSTSPWVVSGTVTANQGTSPWVTGFGGVRQPVDATQTTSPWVVSGTVTANQGGAPWSVSQSGTWTVQQGTPPWTVAGNLTHNNAAPAATNVGGLVGLANAAAPTFTEGRQVLLSTDLAGNLRTTPSGTQTVSGTVTANQGTNPWVVAGNKTNNNAVPGAANVGTLPAVATTGLPAYVNGNQVALSTDLSGQLRVTGVNQVTAAQGAGASGGQDPLSSWFVELGGSNQGATNTGAAGAAVTLTLSAPAAGVFQYITLLEIEEYCTAARTGSATPTIVTSTNLPGNLAWTFDTAQAVGTSITKLFQPAQPIRANNSGTAITIVAPATTSVLWRISAQWLNLTSAN